MTRRFHKRTKTHEIHDPTLAGLLLVLREDRRARELVRSRMTTPSRPAANAEEITAVNLADEHAEEAVSSLGLAKDTEGARANTAALCAMADAILALGARVDALRETLNRELPDIGAAMIEAVREMPGE